MLTATPWLSTRSLDARTHAEIRRRMMFEGFKWDPQVGDVATLSPTPLLLTADAWTTISRLAERLAAECLAAEAELLTRPDLWHALAIPRAVRRALRACATADQRVRVMRFDFHHTTQGWRISEVNSDVPGGYVEATTYTQMIAAHVAGALPAGDPTAALVDALRDAGGPQARVALVHATAYADDAQVMHHLAGALRAAGAQPMLVAPDQMSWRDVDAVLRFFPAEWLPQLGRGSDWRAFFRETPQPQCNPGAALLVQSKRWPLVWDRMTTRLDTWRSLLPTTGAVPFSRQCPAGHVLKPAFGRVGEGVGMLGVTQPREWSAIRRSLWLGGRRGWIMQQRFEPTPWDTDLGQRFPCIGVYVINGKACGAYGRAAAQPLIDQQAQDVAVLVQPPTDRPSPTAAPQPNSGALACP